MPLSPLFSLRPGEGVSLGLCLTGLWGFGVSRVLHLGCSDDTRAMAEGASVAPFSAGMARA